MKTKIRIYVLSFAMMGGLLFVTWTFGQGKKDPPIIKEDTIPSNLKTMLVFDIDGNKYHVVKIGKQKWMLENLKVTKYRDGTPIPYSSDPNEWKSNNQSETGSYCHHNDDPAISNVYGKLYNWYAVNSEHGLAPKGWRIPTENDWITLIAYLRTHFNGTCLTYGGLLKEKGTAHWMTPNVGATNQSGFCALPGGMRSSTGVFSFLTIQSYFWWKEDCGTYNAWCYMFNYNFSHLEWICQEKGCGLSVRCVADN